MTKILSLLMSLLRIIKFDWYYDDGINRKDFKERKSKGVFGNRTKENFPSEKRAKCKTLLLEKGNFLLQDIFFFFLISLLLNNFPRFLFVCILLFLLVYSRYWLHIIHYGDFALDLSIQLCFIILQIKGILTFL